MVVINFARITCETISLLNFSPDVVHTYYLEQDNFISLLHPEKSPYSCGVFLSDQQQKVSKVSTSETCSSYRLSNKRCTATAIQYTYLQYKTSTRYTLRNASFLIPNPINLYRKTCFRRTKAIPSQQSRGYIIKSGGLARSGADFQVIFVFSFSEFSIPKFSDISSIPTK